MIHVKGIIGQDYTFVDFLGGLAAEKGAVIEVVIDSIGGLVDEGLGIYNAIFERKKAGARFVTRAVNNCASIASIILLAGDDRIVSCPLMIHNPWGGVEGDANAITKYAKELEAIEKTLETIYNERTGGRVPKETLSDLMDRETYLSPEQAVALGFATQAATTARALYNHDKFINLKLSTMAEAKEKKSLLERARALISGKPSDDKTKPKATDKTKVFAMELQTVTGGTLTVDREEGVPEVGDNATPDGVHELPEGLIITVTDGVITDIKEVDASAEGEETPEGETIVEEQTVEQLVETVTELVEEVEKLEEEAASSRALAKTREEQKILNAVAMAGGYEKVFGGKNPTKPVSNYAVTRRANAQGKPTNASSEGMKSKLEAARAKAEARKMKGGRK